MFEMRMESQNETLQKFVLKREESQWRIESQIGLEASLDFNSLDFDWAFPIVLFTIQSLICKQISGREAFDLVVKSNEISPVRTETVHIGKGITDGQNFACSMIQAGNKVKNIIGIDAVGAQRNAIIHYMTLLKFHAEDQGIN